MGKEQLGSYGRRRRAEWLGRYESWPGYHGLNLDMWRTAQAGTRHVVGGVLGSL